jgi:hypothetical protein
MADPIQTPGLDTKKTFDQLMGVQRPYLEGTAKAREAVAGAEADIARAQQAQAQAKATAMVEPTQKYVSDVQSAQQAYQEKKEAEPIPAFVPTRDSAEDLAKLFSFIGVMGTFVGRGAGKQASMGAMSAMTGMMNGWQQGRTDLYNQEKVKFEKDFNRVQKLHQDLAKDLETAVKTAATNKELGIRLAEEAAIRSGSDIVAAQVKKGNLVAALETTKEMASAAQKVGAQVEKLLEADIRGQAQVAAAQARAGAVKPTRPDIWVKPDGTFVDASKEPGGIPPAGSRKPSTKAPDTGERETRLKPGALETKAYRSSLIFKDDLTSIAKSLVDPELVQDIKKYRVEAFLSEEGGKAISQLMNESIPSKLRTFLTTIRNFRNNYYLDISGKAVTGGEALRNYGVVMQPGDSPELMRDKIDGLVDRVERNIGLSEQIYAFPKGISKPGQKTDLKPGEQLPVLGAAKKQQMPAADKLKAYANTHFGGDVAKAKAYLAEQGYEE